MYENTQSCVKVSETVNDDFLVHVGFDQVTALTLQAPTPQNGQTHSSNSSATTDKLF